jgi:hypothetical protein
MICDKPGYKVEICPWYVDSRRARSAAVNLLGFGLDLAVNFGRGKTKLEFAKFLSYLRSIDTDKVEHVVDNTGLVAFEYEEPLTCVPLLLLDEVVDAVSSSESFLTLPSTSALLHGRFSWEALCTVP